MLPSNPWLSKRVGPNFLKNYQEPNFGMGFQKKTLRGRYENLDFFYRRVLGESLLNIKVCVFILGLHFCRQFYFFVDNFFYRQKQKVDDFVDKKCHPSLYPEIKLADFGHMVKNDPFSHEPKTFF